MDTHTKEKDWFANLNDPSNERIKQNKTKNKQSAYSVRKMKGVTTIQQNF